jgi:hypothetical protein
MKKGTQKMKRLFPALTAALMASSMAALPLQAQDGGASQQAPGIVKQELEGSAKGEVRAGKQMKPGASATGEASGAAGARADGAGQAAGGGSAETGASAQAPGTVERQEGDQSARDAAPGQMQQSGEADSARDAAPGRQMQDAQAPSDETTASIDLSSEQRTEIRDVIVESRVEPVEIDVNLSVGVAVPRTVTLNPLPPRIIEIVPAYSGYQYFVLADGRIIIVEPATYEVVYILAA